METKYPSPDGTFVFQIFPWEARMSLWIESPRLVRAATGETVLEFRDENWSLDGATWTNDITAELTLRKYPGAHQPSDFKVVINCDSEQASIYGAPPIPFQNLESALDARVDETTATARTTHATRRLPLFRWIRECIFGRSA